MEMVLLQLMETEQVIGNANPEFTGGWNNQVTYQNFDLGFL